MKFSIIVPAYKPQFLKECIESVLTQTYDDWELVIVNDASPYDLDCIVSEYDDERILYFKRKTGFGARELVKNWNECLTYVKGEYVMCIGDDDKLLNNCLADYVRLISDWPGRNIYHTRVEYIDTNSNVIGEQDVRPVMESTCDLIIRKLNGGKICIGEFLFNTNSLRRKGGFYYTQYGCGADDITSWEMAKSNGCINCNQIGFQYRESDLTISNRMENHYGKYEATFIWEEWFNNFIASSSQSAESINTIKERFIPYIAEKRKNYAQWYVANINKDINERLFKGFFFWLKKTKREKCTIVKRRTLCVFLFCALRNKFSPYRLKQYVCNHT